MSIRDHDPLFQRAARRQKRAEAGGKRKKGSIEVAPRSKTDGKIRGAIPIKLGVGKTQFKIDDKGSAATLGRDLNRAFDEIAKNFRWFVDQLEGYLPQDLENAVKPTFELSQYYCPVDTGTLKASGYLVVEGFRGGARVEMGYGKGGSPDYAIYVHEMPFQHAAPTSNKFLERAVDEDYYNILQRVTDNVRIRVGG